MFKHPIVPCHEQVHRIGLILLLANTDGMIMLDCNKNHFPRSGCCEFWTDQTLRCLLYVQVKRQCNGCGNGGDWALKVDAQQTPDVAARGSHDQATDAASQSKPQRISVLFYVADEQDREMLLDPNKLHRQAMGSQPRLCSSGYHPIAGNWQLHVSSSSTLTNQLRATACSPEAEGCCMQP